MYNCALQEKEHIYDDIDEKEVTNESTACYNTNVDEENTNHYDTPRIPSKSKDARKPGVMPVSQDHQHLPTNGSLSSQEEYLPPDIIENLHASHYETQGAENNQYTSLIVSQQTPCEGYQKLVSQPSSST